MAEYIINTRGISTFFKKFYIMIKSTTKVGKFIVDKDGISVWIGGAGKGATGAVDRRNVLASVSTVGEYTGVLERNDPVPQKPIAAMSFGQRVRIERLWAGY